MGWGRGAAGRINFTTSRAPGEELTDGGTQGLEAHKESGGVRVRRCLRLNHDDAEKDN